MGEIKPIRPKDLISKSFKAAMKVTSTNSEIPISVGPCAVTMSSIYVSKMGWCKSLLVKVYGKEVPGVPEEDLRRLDNFCKNCACRFERQLLLLDDSDFRICRTHKLEYEPLERTHD